MVGVKRAMAYMGTTRPGGILRNGGSVKAIQGCQMNDVPI